MNVSVTRNEIEVSAEMLGLLRSWESLSAINGEYSRGSVSMSVDGNAGRATMTVSTDAYSARHTEKDPVKRLHQQISGIVGASCADAASKVCKLIRESMPIPISDTK